MKINLVHNYKLKAMALLLAVLSWGIVKQITNYDKDIDGVPISIILPEGWAIREQSDTEVRIAFQGTQEDVLFLNNGNVQVLLDLRETEFESEKELMIRPRQVAYTGKGTRITNIYPESIRVRLGKEGHKQVPVLINRVGEPPEGVKAEAIEATPKIVTLYGEQDLLESVNSLQSSPLVLSDRIQSFDQRLDVLPPTEGWVGRIDPPRIQVRVTLAGLTEERLFEKIPLLFYHAATGMPAQDLVATPSTVDVFLKGSPQLLDKLNLGEIKAFVAANPKRNGLQDVLVMTRPGIEVLGVQPTAVRISPAPTPTPTPTPVPPPEPEPTRVNTPSPTVTP
jgi:YbbR domain-containing protein